MPANALELNGHPPPVPLNTDGFWELRHILEVGEKIWVRENWRADVAYDDLKPSHIDPKAALWFEAHDGHLPFVGNGVPGKLRPSIFLPRWASRMTLIVKAVKIERLQDISEEDALAEGAERFSHEGPGGYGRMEAYHHGQPSQDDAGFNSARNSYRDLWQHINGAGSWNENPWVIAYTFDVLKQNIDETR